MAQDHFAEQYHSIHLAIFKVGEFMMATKINQVEQIIFLDEVRKLPNMPGFIEGVFDYFQKIVTVIDLRKVFKITGRETEDLKVIIYSLNDKLIGFIVDDVTQVVQKFENELNPSPPPIIQGVNPDCIFGMLKENDDHVLLIDLDKILTYQETQIVSQVAQRGT